MVELEAAVQIFVFAVFAFISVAGALGMTTTMSMFRSAIFLMASFIGVAGLFILLMADLLGLLQVMMYIGGMLVMALFMVLFSGDPGGAMMTSMMELPLPEKFFSLGLAREDMMNGHGSHDHHGGHGGDEGHHEHGGEEGGNEHQAHPHAAHEEAEGEASEEQRTHDHHQDGEKEEEESGGEEAHDGHDGMDMEPMFIMQQKKPAAVLALVVWVLLSALVLLRPAWPVKDELPAQNSAEQIGDLLMNKYMIAFEGAGLMILLGIFGAVYLSRPGRFPDPTDRDEIQAAIAETPAPIEPDPLEPVFEDARQQTAREPRPEEEQRSEEDA